MLETNILRFPSRYIAFAKDLPGQTIVPPDSLDLQISVVIPVFNRIEYTRNCLKSLFEHYDESFSWEIILVDNASSDGTAAFVRDKYKEIKVIQNPKNLGFAKACNQGALVSQAPYILFLNNDTYFADKGWLKEMLTAIQSSEDIGIVGNRQLFPHSEKYIMQAWSLQKDKLPMHIHPHLPKDFPKALESRYMPAVTGACMLVKRQVFYEAGMFDENFVNGYEDTDLCLKFSLLGQKTWYCASSCIYHFGFISENRTAKDHLNVRYFLEKWSDRISQNDFLYA